MWRTESLGDRVACSLTCNMILFFTDISDQTMDFFFLSSKTFCGLNTSIESRTFLHPETCCRWLHLVWRSKGGGEEERSPLKKSQV